MVSTNLADRDAVAANMKYRRSRRADDRHVWGFQLPRTGRAPPRPSDLRTRVGRRVMLCGSGSGELRPPASSLRREGLLSGSPPIQRHRATPRVDLCGRIRYGGDVYTHTDRPKPRVLGALQLRTGMLRQSGDRVRRWTEMLALTGSWSCILVCPAGSRVRSTRAAASKEIIRVIVFTR